MRENLLEKLAAVRSCDYFILKKRIQNASSDKDYSKIEDLITKSIQQKQWRVKNSPKFDYPESLPISSRAVEITEAIRSNQVVVICGETGSGKTTQLPKFCLQAGRGIEGIIGHTQPRRLAARTVSNRIADELHCDIGGAVGFKVRHTDITSSETYIKLMTDGVLLAELQQDRFLNQYDTIIIDEAHERSLNIDFLLGYLKNVIKKRHDLKIIITSATIDVESFSAHFNEAPIIEVSGRTYPVEIRYRPVQEELDETHHEKMIEAINELSRIDLGDILIFLEGEGDIHEVDKLLRKQNFHNTEVLPLYSRLSTARQNKIFKPHKKRHIVLATNVAETSLTIPGIRYVIDKGYARISRYSYKSKVQRLPIEKISQASANQRKGRCGRVSEGICIRLYDEIDFESRRPFTEPEILRTNLASVILQMKALKLGSIEDFPFLEPPESKFVSDGKRLLLELNSIDEKECLTKVGKQMVRLPIEPRYARMIIAANEWNCLNEILIIVSGLSIQSPKERPLDMQEKADKAHSQFDHEDSDFIWFINIWNFFLQQQKQLSQNQLRKSCKTNFLSYARMLEWVDVHHQLKQACQSLGFIINSHKASYANMHCALMTGLLSHIGFRSGGNAYEGARGNKHFIYPGSSQFHKKPTWHISAEIVETSKVYARTVAHVEVNWILKIAEHLFKRHYSDAYWSEKSQCVIANERITLYGLTLVANKRVNYGRINVKEAHKIFIREGMLLDKFFSSVDFFVKNKRIIDEIRLLEKKSRRPDILDEDRLYEFYNGKIPDGVNDSHSFSVWHKSLNKKQKSELLIDKTEFMRHDAEEIDEYNFPDTAKANGISLPVKYEFEPGGESDGVHIDISIDCLNRLSVSDTDFLVPGLLLEKIIFLLKQLPKPKRKLCVPVPETARLLLQGLNKEHSLLENLSYLLFKHKDVDVNANVWQSVEYPVHLQISYRLYDLEEKLLAQSRNLLELKQDFFSESSKVFKQLTSDQFVEREVSSWDFSVIKEVNSISFKGKNRDIYSGLQLKENKVYFRYFESLDDVTFNLELALRQLFLLELEKEIKYLKKNVPKFERVKLICAKTVQHEDIWHDFLTLLIDMTCMQNYQCILSKKEFVNVVEIAKKQLITNANELLNKLVEIMQCYDEANSKLSNLTVNMNSDNVTDIEEQLQWLVYDGFLQETPVEWLVHYPRYLNAIKMRIEKLQSSFNKDTHKMNQILSYWEKAKQAYAKMLDTGVYSKQIEDFRWMLEEYRVSLFAQELRTNLPISAKRLDKHWQMLKEE